MVLGFAPPHCYGLAFVEDVEAAGLRNRWLETSFWPNSQTKASTPTHHHAEVNLRQSSSHWKPMSASPRVKLIALKILGDLRSFCRFRVESRPQVTIMRVIRRSGPVGCHGRSEMHHSQPKPIASKCPSTVCQPKGRPLSIDQEVKAVSGAFPSRARGSSDRAAYRPSAAAPAVEECRAQSRRTIATGGREARILTQFITAQEQCHSAHDR